jgi:hypothetical protein
MAKAGNIICHSEWMGGQRIDYLDRLEGGWLALFMVTRSYWRGLTPEWQSIFARRFMVVKPLGYLMNDYVVLGRRSCPLTWVRALWYRTLARHVVKIYYRFNVFLYRTGISWWPEGTRVGFRWIGRRPDNKHERQLWREDRYWAARRIGW